MITAGVIGIAVCQVAAPKQLRKNVIGGLFARRDKGRRESRLRRRRAMAVYA